MRQQHLILAIPAAALAVASMFAWQRSQSRGAAAAPTAGSLISLRIRFGLNDKQGRAWDGSITAASGEIVNLRNWRPRPDDRVEGNRTWSLSTRQGPAFQVRAWEKERLTNPPVFINTVGVIADIRTTENTKLRVETKNGTFEVNPNAVEAGTPHRFLNEAVEVDLVPAAQVVSDPSSQSEFAAIQAGSGNDVWVAWVAWQNGGNQVRVRRFDGTSWAGAEEIAGAHRDIYQVRLGRDGKGGIWAIWSAQVNGNWDLYARRFDGKAWSNAERLTTDAQPDINQRTATDSAGNLWLVWQGFRNGTSDVFARRYDGSAWSAEERVSTSPANDWDPAIAADSAGRVYVAWDTYDKGNYDILLRTFGAGRWSEVSAVASTPKFEAYVSLACDRQNRLWAAWNESGIQWGKDTGFLVQKSGTQLYEWRTIAAAVRESSGDWREPVQDINSALPPDLRDFNDLPTLQSDGAGRVWLFFRHRTLRIRDVPFKAPAHRAAWELFGTTYDGGHWITPVAVPFSHGRTEMRGAFTATAGGPIFAAWATDNRDFEEFLFERAEVYTGRLPEIRTPPRPLPMMLKPRAQPELTVFSVHENEPADLRRIRDYTIQSEGKTYKIYRGDTHRHTEFSMDGNFDGSLLEAYRYAIDAISLDFLGVSEHNGLGGPDIAYINWLLQQRVDVFHLPGTFTPLFAYERSVGYPNGHRNVIFSRRGNPTLAIPPEEQKAQTGAKALYDYLKKNQGIAISHTSATTMGTDWRDNDPEVEPLVEIYQGDRVSAEYEGAPKAAWRGGPASQIGGFRPAGYVWNAWAKGYKLGVQSSSDHLSTHISYAATIAADSSREGLLEAMRKRHSYGATDNIILDYRLQAGGREYLQGDIVDARGDFRLWVKVIGTQPVRQIDIIKNNTFVHTRQPLEKEATFTFTDNQPSPGESYYYVRALQVDENIAWSSPIWVKR